MLITGGMGLTVLGLQQSSVWGWSSVATWACIDRRGRLLTGLFIAWELRTPDPLLRLQIFRDRAFAIDNAGARPDVDRVRPVLLLRERLRAGFAGRDRVARRALPPVLLPRLRRGPQIGGRILDRRGASPALVFGSALGAVGFYLLAGKLTDLSLGQQTIYIMLAGAGVGLMLGPASTDAVNRAARASYSEVTGITQTARNFGASLGLAVLGAILVSRNNTNVTSAL